MNPEIDLLRGRYYFIGIGGVSMSALALLLKRKGLSVRGSDAHANNFTQKLLSEGIPLHIGETEEITEETVVYTGAIEENHPQMRSARKAGKRLISRSELLGRVAQEYPHVLSVAGCHGKTTATSMLAHIFYANDRPFTSHIGGEDLDLGNLGGGGGDYFVTEACEFRRSFLSLKSEIGVILNVDRDHTDCYADDHALYSAYAEFAARSRRVVVNADDPRARGIPHNVSFGLFGGDVRAENLRQVGEKYSFTISERSLPLVRVKLNVVGKVNVLNALAAFSAARLVGFSAEEIRRGLESFRGVKRRFEQVGTLDGVPVVCDYAHHPREIYATVKAAQRLVGGRVKLVFQPHTYTRTRDLMEDFISVLKEAEEPILYRTYAAREPFDPAGSAVSLMTRLPSASYVQSPEQLKERLKRENLGTDDLILVLGAGDIYEIALGILDDTP